jgi:hypothetical protein
MSTVVPAVATTACRGLCVAIGGFSLTATAPVIGITLGIAALTSLAFYALSRPKSSVRLSCGNAEAEFRRGWLFRRES